MDQMYGVSYSEDSLMHYRTKGSRNGYSTDPNYTPIGQKAQGPMAVPASSSWTPTMRANLARQGIYTATQASQQYMQSRNQVAQQAKAAEQRRQSQALQNRFNNSQSQFIGTQKPQTKPKTEPPKPNPQTPQEYARIMQQQAAQQASQKEKEEAARKRQAAMQRVGWLAGKAAEGIGNAVKTSVGTGLQLANQKAEEMTAKERAKKEEARLKQAQYKKARDEGRAYERSRQSNYSKIKGAAHYKVEEGKRAVNKAVRAGKKTLGEVSADVKKKGRDTLAKLGVGDVARDAGRIAERAKEAVSGALEKGRKRATEIGNRVTDAYRLNRAKNDREYLSDPNNWGKIGESAARDTYNRGKDYVDDLLNKRKRR